MLIDVSKCIKRTEHEKDIELTIKNDKKAPLLFLKVKRLFR